MFHWDFEINSSSFCFNDVIVQLFLCFLSSFEPHETYQTYNKHYYLNYCQNLIKPYICHCNVLPISAFMQSSFPTFSQWQRPTYSQQGWSYLSSFPLLPHIDGRWWCRYEPLGLRGGWRTARLTVAVTFHRLSALLPSSTGWHWMYEKPNHSLC